MLAKVKPVTPRSKTKNSFNANVVEFPHLHLRISMNGKRFGKFKVQETAQKKLKVTFENFQRWESLENYRSKSEKTHSKIQKTPVKKITKSKF